MERGEDMKRVLLSVEAELFGLQGENQSFEEFEKLIHQQMLGMGFLSCKVTAITPVPETFN